MSLCIWLDRVQQNTTDVFSCLSTRRKMHSFILFPSTSPPASCPFCVWEMSLSLCSSEQPLPQHETVFKCFYFTRYCPSLPPHPTIVVSQSHCFGLSTFKTPMWAKCHCVVGKFSRLNWNALSRHRWGGRKNRIKRTESSFIV